MTIDELRRAAAEFADLARAGATPVATPVPGLTIVRSRAPTEIAPVLYEPLFCLVLQGAKQTSVDGRMLSFRAGQSLVVSHDRPSLSRIVEASAASLVTRRRSALKSGAWPPGASTPSTMTPGTPS